MNDLPPLPTQFKNRKTGLRIFGLLTLLVGLLFALFTLFLLKAPTLSHNTTAAPEPASMILSVLIFGGFAAVLIWLGVGSMMCRRWARALLLMISWSVLIIGACTLAFMVAMMLPQFMASIETTQLAGPPVFPKAAMYRYLLTVGAIFGVIMVVIPAIWINFYGSGHVKATCEASDPVERWTDRCPLPVIAGSLMTAFGALSMLATAFSGHGAIPFFGIFLSGLPGTLVYIVWALIMGYGAWAMYRLDLRGWWIVIGLLCLWPVSSAITFWHHDITEFYKLMGYSADQMAAIQKIGLLKGPGLIWLTLLSSVPWIGFLLYLRKFFRRTA